MFIFPSEDSNFELRIISPLTSRSIFLSALIPLEYSIPFSLYVVFKVCKFFLPSIFIFPLDAKFEIVISPELLISISSELEIIPSCLTPNPLSVLMSLIFFPYIAPKLVAYIPYLSEVVFLESFITGLARLVFDRVILFSPAIKDIFGSFSAFKLDISLYILIVLANTLK